MLAAFGQALGLLLCCAFPVGVVLLAVFARRRRDKRLAEHWRELQARRALAGDEAAVAVVERVYQRARRGAKAVIRWQETGDHQDTWFKGRHPAPGSVLLLRGSTGWGPHNRNPNTYYVNPGDLLYSAPSGTIAAARRQRRRDAQK
ncbi:hypothetical protein [Amycolatopsis saalfeldensis]|uniref:hypothetical protein n=1 Tax=Amycolatopsis saalfeldensis TaxID=394193 RepID=UPI001160310F|nr:hypothetical protein [Amycolatopsis saalfeldensis]